jgi:uncharacterized membrane protein YbhN (UPF0104 family)
MSPAIARLINLLIALAVVISLLTCWMPVMTGLIERLPGLAVEVRLSRLALAFALSVLGWLAYAYIWKLVLGALGHSLPADAAVRIWCLTQSCRWLPGGVWHYGSRTIHAAAHGIPSTAAVASVALELMLTVAASAVLAGVGMAVYGGQHLHSISLTEQLLVWCLPVALVLSLLGVATWIACRWFPRKVQALQERFAALRLVRPRLSPTAVCLVAYVLLAAFFGLAFSLVIAGVAPQADVPLLAAIAVNSAAWLVGLFAVMAPGGLVVRETALALQLGLWMSPGSAIAVAIVWRLVQLAAELICVAIALVPRSFPIAAPGATARQTVCPPESLGEQRMLRANASMSNDLLCQGDQR